MTTSRTNHPQAPPTKTTSNPNPKHTNTLTNEAIEGQQDGVQDEKGEGDAEEKKKFDKKVVNFFVTNFPVSSCKTSLHDLFAECGEILDVYIARKLSKVGKRFGFARFSHVGDVQALENQLNGITIGRFKLIANIAKFERCSSKSWQGVSKPLQIRMVSFVTSTNQTEWLKNVLVGEATSIHSLLDLRSLFRSFDDVTDCTVKHLGGLRCMLDFENKQDALDFLLNRKDYWLDWFKWLQPWTSEIKTEDRITWLRIEGLPIHVWCSEAFSQIASVWGTVLIPDECESNDPNFVYGKVCILTREMHHLNKVMDIKVDGLLTKIRVSESLEDLDSLFGFKKPNMAIKDDLIFDDSVPSLVDDHGKDMVGETKPVDGSIEGTPVVSNEIPVKKIIDSDRRGIYGKTTKWVCNERDGTMTACAGSYASSLRADCSLSESRTNDTTRKIQKKEKVVMDTCDSLSFDLNLRGAGPTNIPSKLNANLFKKQTCSTPIRKNYMSLLITYWVDKSCPTTTDGTSVQLEKIKKSKKIRKFFELMRAGYCKNSKTTHFVFDVSKVEELKDISPKLRSSKALEVLRHLAL